MKAILIIVAGFVFPPIWFIGAGGYIAEAHTKQIDKAQREHRRRTRYSARYEQNLVAHWRRRYGQANRNRIAAENSLRSSQAARVKETQAHNRARKRMAAVFVRIVKICNERKSRMPARIDRIRELANAGRGFE